VPERVQVVEHHPDARPVVEEHLPHGRARERVADRHDGQRLADVRPGRVGGVERRDDQAVDHLVGELARQHPLALGLPARVDDEHVQVVGAELPAERLDEALLAEVLERAREHAHEPGAPARERARNGVAGVAELFGGLAHALLRLGRGLDAPHRVRDGGGRETGRRGDVLDGDASPRSHTSTVPARQDPTAGRSQGWPLCTGGRCWRSAARGVLLKRFSETVQ
jgi:hypothetical protein